MSERLFQVEPCFQDFLSIADSHRRVGIRHRLQGVTHEIGQFLIHLRGWNQSWHPNDLEDGALTIDANLGLELAPAMTDITDNIYRMTNLARQLDQELVLLGDLHSVSLAPEVTLLIFLDELKRNHTIGVYIFLEESGFLLDDVGFAGDDQVLLAEFLVAEIEVIRCREWAVSVDLDSQMSFVDASEVGVSVERRDSTANIDDGGVTPTILVRHKIIIVLERRLDLNTASL